MTDLDLKSFREIAEKANGNWSYAEWKASLPEPGQEEAWLHIATFNPATVLALIERIEYNEQLWAKNKSLLDEIDRLKDVIGRRDQLVAQYIINDIAAQAETATLRARIEELEKDLGQWIAVAGIGLPK
jgi:hypothetical protein